MDSMEKGGEQFMTKIFNVSADCKPDLHYMVNIESKLLLIKEMVDKGQYFTINRARQYGKTTTLKALAKLLGKDYTVISLDFQRMSATDFGNEPGFVAALAREIVKKDIRKNEIPLGIKEKLQMLAEGNLDNIRLAVLFDYFSLWCGQSAKPVVLMIDEVDSATNNQVFLDFLAQLRAGYIDRDETPIFKSVILAGVYDVKNIRRKLRQEDDHRVNSPWNIAADFLVDMSFSENDITGMLYEYEQDYTTGMNIPLLAQMIFDYTSGYPFLVSRICKLVDERIAGSYNFPDKRSAWTKEGFLEAVKLLLSESNTLFESLTGKLIDFPELRKMLYLVLFTGRSIPYSPDIDAVQMALMFGFLKVENGQIAVANRIFEMRLYNMFLTEEMFDSKISEAAMVEKNYFVVNGHLNMRRVLEKFVLHFYDIYGDLAEKFVEDDGRRYFLLYLKPIINGVGNYYIESQTRDLERTDVIVDYRGEQFVIELKIWRGNAYNTRGENQLNEYLDYYRIKKGYMLSFNFNKKKQIGVKEIPLGNKILVEAVV